MHRLGILWRWMKVATTAIYALILVVMIYGYLGPYPLRFFALRSGWKMIDTAPRDGTVIEVAQLKGIPPHSALCSWRPLVLQGYSGKTYRVLPHFRTVADENLSMGESEFTVWRPASANRPIWLYHSDGASGGLVLPGQGLTLSGDGEPAPLRPPKLTNRRR